MRADDDNGNAVAAHDLFQHLQAAHAGHFQIKSDHLRLEVFDFFQSEVAIHGCTHDVDGIVGFENLGNELAHQGRVIDHQYADRLGVHCRTSADKRLPAAAAMTFERATSVPLRTKRSMTAVRFMISTTRPSPRIDAPLTRSVAMV